MSLRQSLLSIIGDRNRGRIAFLLGRDDPNPWGGPFNGQNGRRRIFDDVMSSFVVSAIVETGTYRASTTELFAATGKPVYTVEAVPRQAGYSRARLRKYGRRVKLFEGDSRAILRKLAADHQVPKSRVFFYLDAHWEEDLPLAEELDIVLSSWSRSVVMIDDFEVPRSTYGYDDYGPGKRLTIEYLADVMDRHGARAFYPALPAEEETGARRGSVLIAKDNEVCAILSQMGTVVEHPTG